VGGNRVSLDRVNGYRLEAYDSLLFGASSDSPRSCGKTITVDPPRRRDGVKQDRLPACFSIHTISYAFQVFAVFRLGTGQPTIVAGGGLGRLHFLTGIVRAGRGLALKVREKLRSQKCRIVLVKKPLDCLQFREHGLDLAAFRAGPDGKILGQPGDKFLIRHVVDCAAKITDCRRMSACFHQPLKAGA
jgi:hypothetical protein